MSYRICKYGCGTEIGWDKALAKFVERGGEVHDRGRCEGLRPKQESVKIPPFDNKINISPNPVMTASTVQIPKEDWDKFIQDFNKVIDLLTKISHNVALMTEHYDGLVEQQRQLTRLLTKPLDEKLAQAEARYDRDREQGIEEDDIR